MSLPWALEDWLTDAGDRVVNKLVSSSMEGLSNHDALLYEIWLLDTEIRNGGLSQYFCNRGIVQWERCVVLASSGALASFAGFATRVRVVLQQEPDPYLAIVNSTIDGLWSDYQTAVISELRSACSTDASA